MKKSRKKRMPRHLDFSVRAQYGALSESPSVWEFSRRWLRETRGVALWEHFIKYFRRFRFVTTAFRIAPWILLAISTNTLLYIIAALAVFLVPVILLVLLSLTGSVFIRHRGINDRFRDKLSEKTVFVLFPLRGVEFTSETFWRANARDLAGRKNSAVIVVSPYLFASHGIAANGKFYFNAREEEKNLYLVRRHYFFSLRKNVLTRCVGRLILMY